MVARVPARRGLEHLPATDLQPIAPQPLRQLGQPGTVRVVDHGLPVPLQLGGGFPAPPAKFSDAVAAYEMSAKEFMDTFAKMPDARLGETIQFFAGPGKLADYTVSDFLWFMFLDSVHHRGQLSVYVRMAGGKVPSIYGPSADEPWSGWSLWP